MPKSEQTSWVFANVRGGITRAISQLQKINSVETVTPVTGRFDLVIKLRTNEPHKAFNIVEKIREIKGITSTQTGISLQKISNKKKDESEDPIAFALVKVKGAYKNVLQKIKTFRALSKPTLYLESSTYSPHSTATVQKSSWKLPLRN